MAVRAGASFADPAKVEIKLLLTGPLEDFEQPVKDLDDTPHYRVQNIITVISDASFRLRRQVESKLCRVMLPQDIGL